MIITQDLFTKQDFEMLIPVYDAFMSNNTAFRILESVRCCLN